jgi:four helix bundle protein
VAGADDDEGIHLSAVRRSPFDVRRSSFVVRGGTEYEQFLCMAGARRYEDLEAWQLADALKREVHALTASGPSTKDFKFRDQIRDSAASNSKNIAEGFGRFHPGDFAHFVEFAVASAMETQDSLKDGVDRGYFRPERVANAQRLAKRSIQCSTKFIVYLKKEAQRRRRKKRPDGSNNTL